MGAREDFARALREPVPSGRGCHNCVSSFDGDYCVKCMKCFRFWGTCHDKDMDDLWRYDDPNKRIPKAA